jgi:hypothetical protein
MAAGRSNTRKIPPRAAFTSMCQVRGRRAALEIFRDLVFQQRKLLGKTAHQSRNAAPVQ